MTQAVVNVHDLPETSNRARKAFRAKVQRLVRRIERLGAVIYLDRERTTSCLMWGDVTLPLSIFARQSAIIRENRGLYLAVLLQMGRTYENANRRMQALYERESRIVA